MSITHGFATTERGITPLLLVQALSAFNHNQLRSALLTLVAFRQLTAFGLDSVTIVALSTVLIVAPYFLLSIPGGRIADRWSKSTIIRTIKMSEIAIFLLAAIGLLSVNVPLLLLAVLLCGIEAALFGPAKFGILPEILAEGRLIGANAWLSATSIAAILCGMISGSLLILLPAGLHIVAIAGVCVAVVGWRASFLIPPTSPGRMPLDFTFRALLGDFRTCFVRVCGVPGIVAPVLGSSWFWFQGAVNTTLFPLYVEQSPGQPESRVALLLIASTLGAAVGALGSRLLSRRRQPYLVVPLVLLVMALPGIDMWLTGPLTDEASVVRVVIDLFLLSAGTGFYAAPLNAAIQKLTPEPERARLIGVGNTLSGLAMILSGVAILVLRAWGLSVSDMLLCTAVTTALAGAISLARTLPRL